MQQAPNTTFPYRLALSMMFGIMLSLAFPPLELGFLAYWALVPLFFLLESCSRKEAARWGYLAGLFWNLGTLYWIYRATLPGLIGTVLILPVYVGLYSWLHVYLREKLGNRYIFWLPSIWISLEFFRSLGSLGFPWTALAYTQSYYTEMIQYVSITGLFGVSFWVFGLNVIIFVLLKNRMPGKKTAFLVTLLAGLFLLPWLFGRWVMPSQSDQNKTLRISLIQANIDPYLKWSEGFEERNLAIFDSLSRSAAMDNPDMIVWPETATATYVRNRPRFWNDLLEMANDLDAVLLTGSPDFQYESADTYKTFNSMLLFRPQNHEVQSYDKMILVPFGERVPFEDTFEFLQDFLEQLNMGAGDFSPGSSRRLMEFEGPGGKHALAGVICYESVFPSHVRKLINMGGELLVIITNDGWYGDTSGPYQHAQMAVFRAIENRVSIARCANTGISSFIDPYGRILSKSRFNEVFVETQDLPLRRQKTFYSQYGDVFAMAVALFCVLGIATARLRRA